MSIQLGRHTIPLDSTDFATITSSYADEDIQTLRGRLENDGYLCMRGLIPTETILRTRTFLFHHMHADGTLDEGSTVEHPRGTGSTYMGQQDIVGHADFLASVEHHNLFRFFDQLFEKPSCTFPYKWARALGQGVAGTSAHMDNVYMGRGSQNLHTCWIPLGDVPLNNGPLTVLPTSHKAAALQQLQQTYGQMDIDTDQIDNGWIGDDYLTFSTAINQAWVSGDFSAGDVVIFGMHLLHGSITNASDKTRFTVDVRFQPADEPMDERWIGDTPIGHEKWNQHLEAGACRSMNEARQEWGI